MAALVSALPALPAGGCLGYVRRGRHDRDLCARNDSATRVGHDPGDIPHFSLP